MEQRAFFFGKEAVAEAEPLPDDAARRAAGSSRSPTTAAPR